MALELRKWNALLRRTYNIEPEELSEERWAELVCEYRFTEERQREIFRSDLKVVLYGLASELYGG